MIIRKRKKKNADAGFTFVELIVAVTVLAVTITPIMSALVMTSRLNYKGRRKEQALTVAQNVVEGVKAFGIAEVLKQCDTTYSSNLTFVPENSTGVKISHEVVLKTTTEYTVDITGYELMNTTRIYNASDSSIPVEVKFEATSYEFKLENILMGSTYYDADIYITPNTTNIDYIVSYYYLDNFEDANMSNLKYYDIEVDVNVHGDSEVFGTYTGTFLDQD